MTLKLTTKCHLNHIEPSDSKLIISLALKKILSSVFVWNS